MCLVSEWVTTKGRLIFRIPAGDVVRLLPLHHNFVYFDHQTYRLAYCSGHRFLACLPGAMSLSKKTTGIYQREQFGSMSFVMLL